MNLFINILFYFICLNLTCLLNKHKIKTQTWLVYKETNINEFFYLLSKAQSIYKRLDSLTSYNPNFAHYFQWIWVKWFLFGCRLLVTWSVGQDLGWWLPMCDGRQCVWELGSLSITDNSGKNRDMFKIYNI